MGFYDPDGDVSRSDVVDTTTTLELTPIEVDIDGLRDFRTFLGRELDANLRPGAQGINNDHSLGVHFGGHNVGHQVRLARERYFDALRVSTANLAAYIETAELLVDAIARVATRYADADLAAFTSADSLHAELAAAYQAAALARADAAARTRDQETRRELHRMHAGQTT